MERLFKDEAYRPCQLRYNYCNDYYCNVRLLAIESVRQAKIRRCCYVGG
ncbi:MAG: hypothetical protein LBJ00_07495 [Planctomycetaceae bacterium]|nr:hypothetical protein [Planctomycetaceae bacterium]